MKKAMQFALFLGAFLFAANHTLLTAQDLSAEVSNLAKAYTDAYNKGDVEALGAMHAAEVTFVNSTDGSTSTSTRDQVKANFVKEFSEADKKIAINNAGFEAQRDGTVRINGTFTVMSTNRKSSETTTVSRSYDHVLVKDAGQWKLSRMKSW